MRTQMKKYPIERMALSINMEKTGAKIKRSIKESGYTMREIMEITGVTTEQTIYKWYSGKSIPSLETQIILCRLLGLSVTELLVIDGEFDFSEENEDECLTHKSQGIERTQYDTHIYHRGLPCLLYKTWL